MLATEEDDKTAQEILSANGALLSQPTQPISDLLKSESRQDVRVRQVFEAACLDSSYPKFIEVILKTGDIDINEVNEHGQSVLMMTIEIRHLNAVFILMEAGASVNEQVVRHALNLNDIEILKRLLRASPTLSDVLWSEVLLLPVHQILVEAERFSVGTRSRFTETQLARAIRLENIGALLGLIEAGVGVNTADCMGRTAVHTAVTCNNVEMLKVLIERGADVNSLDDSLNTPLDLALKFVGVKKEIVQQLIVADAVVGSNGQETLNRNLEDDITVS